MLTRIALALAFALASNSCISKAKEAIAPAPEGVGTLTCREIVEQCDAQCGDPLCVNRCTAEGNEEAQGQHAALLDCGQRSGCTDQACMEASCPSEIAACMGPAPAEENPAVPTDSTTPPPATVPDPTPSQAPGAPPG